MNLTTTVMMILVFFLLCSGLFQLTFAINQLRKFSEVFERKFWNIAQGKCNNESGSIVTLYDGEDATFIQEYVKKSGKFSVWLGLTKNRTNVSTWSNGDPFIFTNTTVNVTNGEQICEAMDKNTWRGFKCSTQQYFMCYKDDQYVLVEKKKDWCQAELYCREQNKNLVSIRDEQQNQDVIKEGKNKTFWIGLLHDEWEWVDKTCSTYRNWSDPPKRSNNYTVQAPTSSEQMRPRDSGEEAVVCSTGDTRIRVIDLNRTWEEALDYCEKNYVSLLWIKDANDRAAVKQWLEIKSITGTFWIGLRQSIVFGFWIWRDSPVIESNWTNGRIPEMSFSKHCGVIDAATNDWSDEHCFHKHPFICAEKILKF